jgi:hypothetical protein
MENKPNEINPEVGFTSGTGDSPNTVSFGTRLVKVSKVFWTYWRFASERQAIFFRRLRNPLPWTRDPILQKFKFTNAYRASDRVSQYLIREVASKGEQSAAELFFRVILFKLFNKVETWELLQANVGNVSYRDYSFEVYDSILDKAIEGGKRIYSAAYIMPSAGSGGGERKHRFHLKLLEQMMSHNAPERIADMKRMGDAFTLLKSFSGIGDFLAYQFVTDLNYTSLCGFDEMEFVVAGPGARDGIRKCFPELDMHLAADVVRMVTETQEQHFASLGLSFPTLWGRQLQLIDCQNLFCEVDKYSRYAHPETAGISGRTRIKQLFRPSRVSLSLFYPPKWGINEMIPDSLRVA